MNTLTSHEAAHAIVAYHYNIKIKSLDFEPVPHCLVSSKGLSKEQMAVLLCAGSVGEILRHNTCFGYHHDAEMVKALGVDPRAALEEAGRIIHKRWYEFLATEAFLHGNPNSQHFHGHMITLQRAHGDTYVDHFIDRMGFFDMPTRAIQRMLTVMATIQLRFPKLMGYVARFQAFLLSRG